MSDLPEHLKKYASYIQCNKCGRKSHGGDAINSYCWIIQPSGLKCSGVLKGLKDE